ncbi:PEP-CTERM sorting domain-containing protein [Planctomycetota bacterium]|nr:PEP-CTERM sorting domain-containing protein [Planctomycetota bacterium]
MIQPSRIGKAAAVSAAISLTTVTYSYTFTNLNDIIDSSYTINDLVTSDQGPDIIVGRTQTPQGNLIYKWTPSTGAIVLPNQDAPLYASSSPSVYTSDDGNTLASEAFDGGQSSTYRWSANNGFNYPTIPSSFMHNGQWYGAQENGSSDISGDGSTIVGSIFTVNQFQDDYLNRAYRWTAHNDKELLNGADSNYFCSFAFDTSHDGSVIVGRGFNTNNNQNTAYRWTSQTGGVSLGDLDGGSIYSHASAVSSDGNIVTGSSKSELGLEAFIWTENDGMIGLGDLDGGQYNSHAYDLSDDGNIVTGIGYNDDGSTGFVWITDQGMMSVRELLEAQGLADQIDGWSFDNAYVSDDGNWLWGRGNDANNSETYWFAQVPEPGMSLLLGTAAGLLVMRRKRA